MSEAERLGGDRKRVIEAADSDRTTQWMKDAFTLGNSLGFVATPSYLVASEAYVGGMTPGAEARGDRAGARIGRAPPGAGGDRRALGRLFRRG